MCVCVYIYTDDDKFSPTKHLTPPQHDSSRPDTHGEPDTHTHTHTHIYIYVCVCVCVYVVKSDCESISQARSCSTPSAPLSDICLTNPLSPPVCFLPAGHGLEALRAAPLVRGAAVAPPPGGARDQHADPVRCILDRVFIHIYLYLYMYIHTYIYVYIYTRRSSRSTTWWST